jgi:hypothetical protein
VTRLLLLLALLGSLVLVACGSDDKASTAAATAAPAATTTPRPAGTPAPATAEPPAATIPPTGGGPPLKKPVRLKTTGSIKSGTGETVGVTLTFTLQLPAGVSRTSGCSGRLSVNLLRESHSIASRTIPVGSGCTAQLTGTFTKAQIGNVKSLKVRVSFGGNAALRSSAQQSAVPISGRGH